MQFLVKHPRVCFPHWIPYKCSPSLALFFIRFSAAGGRAFAGGLGFLFLSVGLLSMVFVSIFVRVLRCLLVVSGWDLMNLSPHDRLWIQCAMYLVFSFSEENPSQKFWSHSCFLFWSEFENAMCFWGFYSIVLRVLSWIWWAFPRMIDYEYTVRYVYFSSFWKRNQARSSDPSINPTQLSVIFVCFLNEFRSFEDLNSSYEDKI